MGLYSYVKIFRYDRPVYLIVSYPVSTQLLLLMQLQCMEVSLGSHILIVGYS